MVRINITTGDNPYYLVALMALWDQVGKIIPPFTLLIGRKNSEILPGFSQYILFSGIAPRTPPRGSATSPAYRGMTWTWRCITVWPAAARTFAPTL
jgi:hypothetical protein